MSFEKYRVHEVAKDFGKQTKDITQILSTYATTPKNHMQVLEDKELSIIFEYLTQHNQVESLETVFANAPTPKPKAAKGDGGKGKDKAEGGKDPKGKDKSAPKGGKNAPKAEPPKERTRGPSPPARTRAAPPRWRRPSSRNPPPGCRKRSWWTPARAAT